MDTRTGEVRGLTPEEQEALANGLAGTFAPTMVRIDPANLTPRARQQLESSGRTQVSRNSPCPCGSRKRFKRCCMTT